MGDRFILTVEAVQGDARVSLRRLLKALVRSYGLRCVGLARAAATQTDADEGAALARPSGLTCGGGLNSAHGTEEGSASLPWEASL